MLRQVCPWVPWETVFLSLNPLTQVGGREMSWECSFPKCDGGMRSKQKSLCGEEEKNEFATITMHH